MNQDTPIYSSDPATEELTIERNGDEDYWREIAEAEMLRDEADMDDFRDEEEWQDAQEKYDVVVFDLDGDIPF